MKVYRLDRDDEFIDQFSFSVKLKGDKIESQVLVNKKIGRLYGRKKISERLEKLIERVEITLREELNDFSE